MASFSPRPFPAVPEGNCRTEDPDGVNFGETHNLYDTADRRPAIQSGDWQVRQPAMRPRDRGRITE